LAGSYDQKPFLLMDREEMNSREALSPISLDEYLREINNTPFGLF
jgi:hypothetical protein